MVGIVLVSHSQALACALVEMIEQVAGGEVPLAVAAGVGPGRQELGTDAAQVAEAIQAVYSPQGVLVLMDLGSAILSAEMALELLPADMRDKVRFCPAPFVEGAVAAAVQAGLGSDLEAACQAARQALLTKSEQLGEEASPADTAASPEAVASTEGATLAGAAPSVEVELTLENTHGLHLRPAARFVRTAARYNAQVTVRNLTNGRGPVTARSTTALATLGADQGHRIAITASGPEAQTALDELARLVAADSPPGSTG